jgi:predicted 3-demethylubiquinone-9 3-methyltransferase (glyoxalase superfamily)
MTSRGCGRLTGEKRSLFTVSRKDDPMQRITPCLWFDTEGEDAAKFYTSVFPNSKILDISRYGSAGPRPEGSVMTVSSNWTGKSSWP